MSYQWGPLVGGWWTLSEGFGLWCIEWICSFFVKWAYWRIERRSQQFKQHLIDIEYGHWSMLSILPQVTCCCCLSLGTDSAVHRTWTFRPCICGVQWFSHHSTLSADFPCSLCNARFKNERSRRQHLSAHEGRTTCPICGLALSRTYYMRVHVSKVHNIPMEDVKRLLTTAYGPAGYWWNWGKWCLYGGTKA